MKKLLCLLLSLQFIILTPVMAQDDDLIRNTQNDLMLVGGAGVGGAILGLSTLSFVDKPSKHVSNIWTGAAIGVIVGVIVVAYNSAQRGSEELQGSAEFNTFERVAWHNSNNKKHGDGDEKFGTELWQMNF